MLQCPALLNSQASKEIVLRELGEAECIHLATHISWKLSAIVLSPGDMLDSAAQHSNTTSRMLFPEEEPEVPHMAAKILLRALYSALLQGCRIGRALNEAMQTVQHTKHFAHPINWAGYLLIGSDIRLSTKVAMTGQALCELLRTPEKCRDALRVTLHLVEKSLQRIHRGQKNAMYTTQKSIENKVGPVQGWKELLQSVGFRFEPAANGIPSSVFFPQSDPEERLTQCSASLQALLGLNGYK
ncbi:tetratricopeptide repeat protein 28-like [Diaphorina citri]|uniref:Tetratricopeptide repeat protein 28-like n=1 Tax=Diaphorina citri TaxID=121845 RepID=A0A3Q0JFK8_DIACI|nr:tetratricopeptide repeat protein 28-like [Diaphorina citri]